MVILQLSKRDNYITAKLLITRAHVKCSEGPSMKQIHLDQCNTEQDIVYAIYEIQRSLQLSSTIKRVLTMPYNLVNYDMKYNFEQFFIFKNFY